MRIRLFNALDTIRNWGAKPGITEWIGGLLRVGPIYEEAFRGHWAWFSGAQAVGHDSYVSDPFLWDMWLWKTTATDKWADKLYTAWIELMKPLKTNVTIRLPADPAMLRGFGQAPELAHADHTGATLSAGLETGAITGHEGDYVTVKTIGVEQEQVYESATIDLGSDWEDNRWFADWVVLLKRRGNNAYTVEMRSSADGAAWNPWTTISHGNVWNNYLNNPSRYQQFKVTVYAHHATDFALVSVGFKGLTAAELSEGYPAAGEGMLVIPGFGGL